MFYRLDFGNTFSRVAPISVLALGCALAAAASAASRLTPPSELFTSGLAAPLIARFLPRQRFDLQATLRPDDSSKQITQASFTIDGRLATATVALRSCASDCLKDVPVNASIATIRAVSASKPGVHEFSVYATQATGRP